MVKMKDEEVFDWFKPITPIFYTMVGLDLHNQPLDMELALFHNRERFKNIFEQGEFRYTPPWTWCRVKDTDRYDQA
jgi:hypothetical protein